MSEIDPIVERLGELVNRLWKEREPEPEPDDQVEIRATPYEWRPAAEIPQRCEIRDAVDGYHVAIFAIGETLGHIGGMPLMSRVFDAAEKRFGTRFGATLDARWNGAAGLWWG